MRRCRLWSEHNCWPKQQKVSSPSTNLPQHWTRLARPKPSLPRPRICSPHNAARSSRCCATWRPIGRSCVHRADRDLARNPFLTPAGALVTTTMSTIGQPVPYDSATQATSQARQQAAALLAAKLAQESSADTAVERAGLAQALLAEDQARSQFYQTTLAGPISLRNRRGCCRTGCAGS